MSRDGRRPPRTLERVARALLPSDVHGKSILGDLHEEYRELTTSKGRLGARLWYLRQVVVLGVGYARPGSSVVADLIHDLRHSMRSLRRSPVVTVSVVATMALAIGAGTAIFSVVDGVLLRPLPFDRPEELYRVWGSGDEEGESYLDMMYDDIAAVQGGVPAFAAVFGHSTAPRTLLDERGENPADVSVARVAGDLAGTFGIGPLIGRPFSPDELREGRQVALVSHGLWQSRFEGSDDVLGKTVHINERGFEIVGVLTAGIQYPEGADVWRPLAPAEMEDDDREVEIVGRLAGGATPDVAAAQVRRMGVGLARANPETHQGTSAWIQPLQTMVVRDVSTALFAFLGAVGLVLVITCVNTANLLLARAADRRHEVAIRTSLGASRRRVTRYHLTESLLLALMGGLAGIVLGRWLLSAFLALTPPFPRLDAVVLDWRVVLVMAAASAVVGVLSGVGPALHAASTAPATALRDGGGGTRAGGRVRLQSALVTAEIALSTLLAVLAFLLFGTFQTVIEHERGFQYENLFAFDVDPLHAPVVGAEAVAYFAGMLESVATLPGVRSVALSSHPVMEQRGMEVDVEVEGRPASGASERATMRIVSGWFFRTAGISMQAGRPASGDPETDQVELVVNESFVRQLFPGGAEPLGETLATEWGRGRIVGVVSDVSPSVAEPARPIVYLPFQRFPLPGSWLLVRTELGAAIAPDVWRRIREIDPNVLPTETMVVEEAVRASVGPQRFNMLVVALFSVLALGLAAVGIFGVTSHAVMARRGEIGIRRALGAGRPHVLSEVMTRTAALMGVGVAAGLMASVAGARLVSSLLVDTAPTDAKVLLSVAGLLAVVAALAAAVPALRAIRVSPTEALRRVR